MTNFADTWVPVNMFHWHGWLSTGIFTVPNFVSPIPICVAETCLDRYDDGPRATVLAGIVRAGPQTKTQERNDRWQCQLAILWPFLIVQVVDQFICTSVGSVMIPKHWPAQQWRATGTLRCRLASGGERPQGWYLCETCFASENVANLPIPVAMCHMECIYIYRDKTIIKFTRKYESTLLNKPTCFETKGFPFASIVWLELRLLCSKMTASFFSS